MTSSSALARRFAAAPSFLMLIPLLILAACAPGEVKAGLGPDPTEVTEVTVASDKPAIFVGEAVLVRATAKTAGGTTEAAQVDWTTSGGTLVAYTDSTALFTSSTAGSYKVRGRGRKNAQLTDSTVITVSQPTSPIVRVTVSPDPANLPTGGTLGFAVTGTRQDGTTFIPNVTWSATGGTITPGGVYTAGNSAGTYRVMAVETTSSLADTSTVSLASTAPVLQAVVLTPATSSVATGGTQQFSVSGQWSDGSTAVPSVTYSATGGTITAAGLYTAGTTPGTFRVIATQQGGTLADTSAVTITAPVLQAVVLSPASASLATGATQQFSVGGQWSDGSTAAPSVTYSATGGTITAAGLYTAGTTAGTFRVIATQQGGTLADTAVVTLSTTAPVLQAVILTPASVSLGTGATQQFSVSGQWSNGATTAPAVTYAATGGTVTAGGLYTAGASAGTFRVVATQQGGTLADTSTVTITAPVLQAVILTPASVTLASGGTQQFSVSGQWSNGATTAPAVTYAATGGTVTAGGLYTAGASAGTFRVVATQQGGTLADTSVITISAPVLQAVIIAPSSVALATGATQQFTVSGQWSNGATTAPAVTWSANGGSITTGGLYTAGLTGGTFRVIATQQGGTLADTSVVTLTAPAPVLQAIVLTPATPTLNPGGTQQFVASGQWSNGSTTSPPVNYSVTGGTITSGGLFTAGPAVGIYQLIAVVQGGTLADTATITIAAPVAGACSHRPANYTNILPEFDFSAAVPAGGGNERPIAGTAWSVIYDGDGSGGSHFTRMSDPSAPQSPSSVWQLRQPAGDYGTLGSGGGTGFGNVFRSLPANTTALYACWYTKFSNPYYIHPISHKYMNIFTSNGSAIYVQLARYGNYWEALDGASDYPFPTLVNQAPTLGTWILQEVQLVVGNPGIVRVWINGQLRTEGTTHAVAAGATMQEFGLFGHMGGGGFDLAVDQYQYFDNIMLATP